MTNPVTSCMMHVVDCFLFFPLSRKCSTKSVSLWSGSMSWATTPTHLATTLPSSPHHQGAAAASVAPAPSASGTFLSTVKAGHGEGSKPEALTKLLFSCLGCWATRTTRWCDGLGTVRVHTTTRITTQAVVSAEDAGIVPGKAEGQMTEPDNRTRNPKLWPNLGGLRLAQTWTPVLGT